MSPSELHHRRSVRLSGYDYSQEGGYYITIVTHNREHLFGEIINGEMKMSKFGEIAREEWLATSRIRTNVELGEWILMPDHLHGIIFLFGDNVGARPPVPLQIEQFGKPTSGSIPTILRSYKAVVTKRINTLRGTPQKKVWQRGFFDHVLQDNKDYDTLAEYILTNADRWGIDKD